MSRKLTVKSLLAGTAIFLVAFMVIGSISVVGWEFSNSNWFCSQACHFVHPEEPVAQQLSPHKNIKCVDCHIGRLTFFQALPKKVPHVMHVVHLIAGWERPTYAKFANVGDTCQGCHKQDTHNYNLIKTEKLYATDETNSERRLTLTMRGIGRIFGGQKDQLGMNWHSSGNVKYVAADIHNQQIELVEATKPDGTVVTYRNVKPTMSDEDVAATELKTMSCMDCHNRAGHPFRDPETVIDAAFAAGELNPELPYVKSYILKLLETPVDSKEDALEKVSHAYEDYAAQYPGSVTSYPEASADAKEFIEERQEFLADLMVSSEFPTAEDVTWKSFPDNLGHKNFPGCFRCHGGRMQTAEATPIPVNCSTCHAVPLVTQDDKIPAYYLALLDQKKPKNHTRPDWMSKHMDYQGEKRCAACHETARFGVNDEMFCANSGCHSAEWEYLDLTALRSD